MKKFLLSIPKTSVATFLGAVLTYSHAKGYVDGDMAVFLSTVMLAMGLSANVAVSRIRNK
jgi:hypothetical protein